MLGIWLDQIESLPGLLLGRVDGSTVFISEGANVGLIEGNASDSSISLIEDIISLRLGTNVNSCVGVVGVKAVTSVDGVAELHSVSIVDGVNVTVGAVEGRTLEDKVGIDKGAFSTGLTEGGIVEGLVQGCFDGREVSLVVGRFEG